MNRPLRIATRKSPLALWQAEYVKTQLQSLHADLVVELVTFTTQGDKILDTPLAKIGGKGLFVKELETAMLQGQADIAVHSMKDVPMEFPEGLGLATICEREDPTDAFVSNQCSSLNALPAGSKVGTSSLRRRSQLLAARPDLVILDCRGNVNTRLAKLDAGEYDALILASAGLIRLGLSARITQALDTQTSLPACGQGAVGIETRINDSEILALLAPLHHPETAIRVLSERAMNRRLEGGCQVPIAGHARIEHQHLRLEGLVGAVDGSEILRESASIELPREWQNHLQASEQLGAKLGQDLAEALLDRGADRLLAQAEH